MPATVGMIGIGQLGLPIAANLARAGFRVVGYRRTPSQEFIQQGGIALASPGEVTRAADVLLLCLPSEEAQLDVLDRPDGVLSALKPGQIVIDLATYRRAFKVEQARRIEERGGRFLEVEVSGPPPIVAQRKAVLLVGGEVALMNECSALLDAISEHRHHIGELGSAVSMKLVANYMLAIHTLAAAEAMNLATRLGFHPERVVEVIKNGAGGSAMFSIRAPLMAARKFVPAPGPFKTLDKYLDLAEQAASDVGCATPLFSVSSSYFRRAAELGMSEEDIAAVIKLIEADSVPSRPTS